MHTLPLPILLPGLACDEALFAAQLPALAGLPGLAAARISDVHQRADSLPAMAATLLAETSGPLLLLGCSMGGMVALHAALQSPQRVRGLALLGSTARADTPELIALRTQACALFAQGRVDEVLRANAMFAFHPLSQARPGVMASYLDMVQRAGAAQLIRQNHAVMAREDLRPRLPMIRCPSLVVCGEADRLTPPELSREMAQLIPGARLELVPGAGHMLTLEQPARVAALLQHWLGEQARAAAAP